MEGTEEELTHIILEPFGVGGSNGVTVVGRRHGVVYISVCIVLSDFLI